MALLLSLFPGSAFGVQRHLKGCLSFYGQQLGVVFLPLIIWFLGVYHWLIGVCLCWCDEDDRMPYGVKFFFIFGI